MEDNDSFNKRTWSSPSTLSQTYSSSTINHSLDHSAGPQARHTLLTTIQVTDPCRIGLDHYQSPFKTEAPVEGLKREAVFEAELAKALLAQAPIRRSPPSPEPQSTFSFSRAWQYAKDVFSSGPSQRTPLRASSAFQRISTSSSVYRSPSSRSQDQRARLRRSRTQRALPQSLMELPSLSSEQSNEPTILSASLPSPSPLATPPSSSSTLDTLPTHLYAFPPLDTYVIVRPPDVSLLGLQPDPLWSVEIKHAFIKAQSGLKTSACIRSRLVIEGDESHSQWHWQAPLPRSFGRRTTKRNKKEPNHSLLARKMAFFQERVAFFQRNGPEAYREQAIAAGYTARHWKIMNDVPNLLTGHPVTEPDGDTEMENPVEDDGYDYAREEAKMDEGVRHVPKSQPPRVLATDDQSSLTQDSTGLHQMERRGSFRPFQRPSPSPNDRASTPPPPPVSPSSSDTPARLHRFGMPSRPRLSSFPSTQPPIQLPPTSPLKALSIAEEDDPWTVISVAQGTSANGDSAQSRIISSASRAWSAFATISSRPSLTNFLPHAPFISTSALPSFFLPRPASSDSPPAQSSPLSPSHSHKRKRSLEDPGLRMGWLDKEAFKKRRR